MTPNYPIHRPILFSCFLLVIALNASGQKAISRIMINDSPMVKIFTDCDLAGAELELTQGKYNLTDLTIGNDAISSIGLKAGWAVTLYEHENFKGRFINYTASQNCLEDFNDAASSVIVSRTVMLYPACHYSGEAHALGVGKWDWATIQSGVGNNALSSIQIPAGVIVTLFDETGFKGSNLSLWENIDCLNVFHWEDRASSLVISLKDK